MNLCNKCTLSEITRQLLKCPQLFYKLPCWTVSDKCSKLLGYDRSPTHKRKENSLGSTVHITVKKQTPETVIVQQSLNFKLCTTVSFWRYFILKIYLILKHGFLNIKKKQRLKEIKAEQTEGLESVWYLGVRTQPIPILFLTDAHCLPPLGSHLNRGDPQPCLTIKRYVHTYVAVGFPFLGI